MMDDPNAQVAVAICEELVRLGLVASIRAPALQESIAKGTTSAEQWLLELEAAIEAQEGAADAGKAR